MVYYSLGRYINISISRSVLGELAHPILLLCHAIIVTCFWWVFCPGGTVRVGKAV